MWEVLRVFFCLGQWLPAIKIPARVDVTRGNECTFQTINDGLSPTRELFGAGLSGAALVVVVCICVCVWSALSEEYGSPGCMVANQFCSWSAVTGKMFFSLSQFAPEDLVSRDRFGRPVPRKLAHSQHSGWILMLTRGIPPAFRGGAHLFVPSTNYRVSHELTRSRDCAPMAVHSRDSAGTGPVVLKVAWVKGCCTFR